MSVDASAYALIFEDHKIGAAILEDLAARFGANPYVRGGLEAQRETDYRCGAKAVVDFIFTRLDQAAGRELVTDIQPTQE